MSKGAAVKRVRGEGQRKIEMQIMADVYVTCEVCQGKRYKLTETLEVLYRGQIHSRRTNLSITEAIEFFHAHPNVIGKLKTIADVGLFVYAPWPICDNPFRREAQRAKLASELSRRSYPGKTQVYILDEPTTGLQVQDLEKLLAVLHRLVALGNTVVVIEHNLDVIKSADWVIDLGTEGRG